MCQRTREVAHASPVPQACFVFGVHGCKHLHSHGLLRHLSLKAYLFILITAFLRRHFHRERRAGNNPHTWLEAQSSFTSGSKVERRGLARLPNPPAGGRRLGPTHAGPVRHRRGRCFRRVQDACAVAAPGRSLRLLAVAAGSAFAYRGLVAWGECWRGQGGRRAGRVWASLVFPRQPRPLLAPLASSAGPGARPRRWPGARPMSAPLRSEVTVRCAPTWGGGSPNSGRPGAGEPAPERQLLGFVLGPRAGSARAGLISITSQTCLLFGRESG